MTTTLPASHARNAKLAPIFRALLRAKGDWAGASAILTSERRPELAQLVEKAAVSALDSTNDPQLIAYRNDIADALVSASILGRLTGAVRLPFNTRLITATTGPTSGWAEHGKPVAATEMAANAARTLRPYRVGAIAAVTAEVVQPGAVSDEVFIRMLTASVAESIDLAFIDPLNGGSAAKPASITAGGLVIQSTLSVPNIDAAARQLLARLASNKATRSPVFVASHALTAYMATARVNDAPAFPGVGFNGGTYAGLPLIASTAAQSGGSPNDPILACFDSADVTLAIDAAEVSVSTNASIQLDTAPAAGPQSLTSLFQAGMVGLKVEALVDFAVRRSTSVGAATFG